MPRYRNNGNTGPGATAAVYSRYSANMQRPASLEDQERNCRNFANKEKWIVLPDYVRSDAAKTGRKRKERALQDLIESAKERPRPFDILIMDEPSRMARKIDHVIDMCNKLIHQGVLVVFATRIIRSDDPNFINNLTFTAMADQLNSDQLADRVHRGHEGRVLAGMSTGSRCFGYCSEWVPDPNKPWATTRADMLGVKWVPIPSEAAVVIRIYEMFADGQTVHEISMKLNADKVPAARKSRVDDPDRYWNDTTIKRILKNKKYIGQIVWNKTNQVINPETEKTETRENPPAYWVDRAAPELRIVSDDLWSRVQSRLELVNNKITRPRMGGLKRAKRTYLFSGLLWCKCGSPITIAGSGTQSRGAVYACRTMRYKRDCTNRMYIREDRLSGQLLHALTQHLLQPEVMDYFIASVADEFDAHLKNKRDGFETPLEALQAQESQLKVAISRLIATIMDPHSANSDALPVILAQKEADLKRVQKDLTYVAAPRNLADAKLDIETIVRANVGNLQQIISKDPHKAQAVFHRYIKRLTLFPALTDSGEPGFEVIGELDLFASPTGDKHRMMLARSGTGTVQQYAAHVDFVFRFAGVILDPNYDPWENPLIAPLADLLLSEPELLYTPKRAFEWVDCLKPSLSAGGELDKRLNSDYMSWNLRNRAELFADSFGMISLRIGIWNYYMFTRVEPAGEGISIPHKGLRTP
jgi:site-specific DNA recombinase